MPATPHPASPLAQVSVSRRTVMLAGGAAAAASALTAPASATSMRPHPHSDNPFGVGIAAGDPTCDGIILWTRLTGRMVREHRSTQVLWQVSERPDFRGPKRTGVAIARPVFNHAVHADVGQLRPNTRHYYRFRVGNHISATGTFRTMPRPDALVDSFTIGIANCQDWQNGHWAAYRDIAASDLDLVLHLGDYIYEYDPKPGAIRQHNASSGTAQGADQLITLADYRNRYDLYKSDPALQAAHAAVAFCMVWDDHETENNYAGVIDEIDDHGNPVRWQDAAAMARQRAAAYQAWYENTPVRAHYRPGSPDLRIFRRLDVGSLARINLLDTRQYRTDQPGGASNDFGPDALGANPEGTLLGQTQERWLGQNLATSQAVWDVIAQQVMVMPFKIGGLAPVPLANLDAWDGYGSARDRLLNMLSANAVANPIVLTGDIHSSWVGNIHQKPTDAATPVVATEFVATSISSDFPAQFIPVVQGSNAAFNPWVKYFNGATRGWLKMTVTPEQWLAEERSVTTLSDPHSASTTTARWKVQAGTPGAVPA